MTLTKSQKLRLKNAKKNNKQNKQVNAVTRKPAPKRTKSRSMGPSIQKCSVDYLKVLENPFDGGVACVPSQSNFPSNKKSFFSRGTFATGTASVGFAMVNPFAAMFSPNQSQYAIYSSSSTYAGSTFATSGTGVIGVDTNSDMSSANAAARSRLVACGIRCKNTTADTSAGGSLIGVENDDHDTLAGVTAPQAGANKSFANFDAKSRGWKSVVYHPADDDEYDFYLGSEVTANLINKYILGFIATGANQTYDYEVFVAVEQKGPGVNGLSKSPADPVGLALVRNATSEVNDRIPYSIPSAQRVKEVVSKMMRLAQMGAQGYRQITDGFAGQLLLN